MDINGTKFHLLAGERDWEERDGAPLSRWRLWWDRERGFLSLTPKVLRFSQRQGQPLLTARDRRGTACDRYGNFFWITENEKEIRFLPAGTRIPGSYWLAKDLTLHCDQSRTDSGFRSVADNEPFTISRLRGLTVTEHQYLVVGSLQPSGLLIFDLHGGGPPTWMPWPSGQSSPPEQFWPSDMAPAPEGGVWILDGGSEGFPACYWYLDRFFRVIAINEIAAAEEVLPGGGFKPAVVPPHQEQVYEVLLKVSFRHSFSLPVKNAVAIVGLPDGTVLILDNPSDLPYSLIHRFRYDTKINTVELSGSILAEMLDDTNLKAHDLAFVAYTADEPDRVSGELTLVADNGNQAFVFALVATEKDLALALRPRYLPLRRFSGKALVEAGKRIFYDFEERWLPLTPQPRQRFEAEGRIDGIIFDGKEPDCVWHRLMIDGCIPDNTGIEIKTRSANERGLLNGSTWFPEPNLYLRGDGSEIPLHEPFTDKELQHENMGTWELLLQNAKGRYLELRLTLRGSCRATPRIRALRVYYPRFSYLKYLPAVYREQGDSTHLLDRFLANVEGFYSTIEGRIAKAQAILDIRTAPPEFLEWLAGWLGIVFDSEWDDYRRRLFLSHALLVYRWRGTQIGLRAAIRLAIDPCPDESLFDELRDQSAYHLGTLGGRSVRLVENFLLRKFPGVVLGDPSELERPSLLPADDVFKTIDREDTTHQRYRDFLRRTYRGETEKDTLDKINEAWDANFDSIDEITFSPERPPHPMQSRDRLRFLRYEVAVGQPWVPELGAYGLHVRFQEFLYRQYGRAYGEPEGLNELNKTWGKDYSSFEEIMFSPVLPEVAAVADDWLSFTTSALGFTYAAVTVQDEPAYREFLGRRYRRPEALNNAYGLIGSRAYGSFADIELPQEDVMPKDGNPLFDWIQFVSLALPLKRNAHRFTVLVPTEPAEDQDLRRRRMAKVEEIVQREKPAHTDYDVKLYWALFQVGGARLGLDTILGESSRYVALVLGVNYLGQSFLSGSHPWNVTDRTVVGRDPLMEV